MGQTLLKNIQKGVKSALVKQRIITHLIYAGSTTITDLSKSMGLSVPTVTKFVDEMCKEGYVNDCGKLETSGGRHPSLYGLNADSAYFIGVAMAVQSLSLGAINFKGDVLQTKMEIPFKLENTPECLEHICQEIETFIDELPCDKSKILNICIGMTGRVNPETGCSYTHLTFGEKPLAEMFSERLGINVCIDNDSRAMAYGEYIMRSEKCPKNLIYVNVNWGWDSLSSLTVNCIRECLVLRVSLDIITDMITSRSVIAERKAVLKRRYPARLCIGSLLPVCVREKTLCC